MDSLKVKIKRKGKSTKMVNNKLSRMQFCRKKSPKRLKILQNQKQSVN